MRIAMEEPSKIWSDYRVTNEASGRSYRVALRGWEHGESFCSCPDFRANTLGTCKHILRVAEFARKRFPAKMRAVPYQPEHVAVYVRHGHELELRMQVPSTLPAEARTLVAPLLGQPVTDMHGLLACLRGLAALGIEPIVYPDAEELIQQALFREHMDADSAPPSVSSTATASRTSTARRSATGTSTACANSSSRCSCAARAKRC